MKDHSKEDYFWVPIRWEIAEYLLENYRKDWEGFTPNGVDLDAWVSTLEDFFKDHCRIHFPRMVTSPQPLAGEDEDEQEFYWDYFEEKEESEF